MNALIRLSIFLLIVTVAACNAGQQLATQLQGKPTCTKTMFKTPAHTIEAARELKVTKKQMQVQISMLEAQIELAEKSSNSADEIAILKCELEHARYVASQLE